MGKNKKLIGAIIALIAVTVGFAGYWLLGYLSNDREGYDFMIEAGGRIFIVLFFTWVTIRWFRIFIWDTYREHDISIPSIVEAIANILIIFAGIAFITTQILGQSIWGLIASLSFVGVALGLAAQDIVKDAIAGIILEVDKNFSRGDFVKVDDSQGEIVDINWHKISLLTPDNTVVSIPNKDILAKGIENFDLNNEMCMQVFEVSLDQDIPVERGTRILHGAMMKVPELWNAGPVDAYAIGANEGGIVYAIHYPIKNIRDWRLIKHKVYAAITSTLHVHGYKLSETFGEYVISKPVDFEIRAEFTLEDEIRNVELFSTLTKAEIKELSQKSIARKYINGEVLINEGDAGDSMFIIAEGAVGIYKNRKEESKTEDVKIEQDLIACLGSGQFFGEAALLTGEIRNASVKAESDVFSFEITKEALTGILNKRPKLAEQMAKIATIRKLESEMKSNENSELARMRMEQEKGALLGKIMQFFGLGIAS